MRAGTGKSVLLREIIKARGSRGRHLAVTAATGIASVNIGGCTLHSWAGIQLGKESAEKLAGKLLGQDKYLRLKEEARRRKEGLSEEPGIADSMLEKDSKPVERWLQVETLIIDESQSSCTN